MQESAACCQSRSHFLCFTPEFLWIKKNILFLSRPSFSCFPKPGTMLSVGEMSHALKLLLGLGSYRVMVMQLPASASVIINLKPLKHSSSNKNGPQSFL